MNRILAIALSLALIPATALAKKGKVDPSDCPCYDLMIDLAAQTECTSFVNNIRVDKGKRGTIKRVLWLDHDPELEADPDTNDDTDSCYLVDVNTPQARVYSFSGFPSGGTTCYYATGIPDRPDPPRCRIGGLTDSELKACFATLDSVRSEVQSLPYCPEPVEA